MWWMKGCWITEPRRSGLSRDMMLVTLLAWWREPFCFSRQASRTVSTAAFWRWSVSSSGFGPWRSSPRWTTAAGTAGRPWRSTSASGSRKLRPNCSSFSPKRCSQLNLKSLLVLVMSNLQWPWETNRILLSVLPPKAELMTPVFQCRMKGCNQLGEHELQSCLWKKRKVKYLVW